MAASPHVLAEQEARPSAVQEKDAIGKKPDPLAIAAEASRNFKSERLFTEYDSRNRRVLVIFWGNVRGRYTWKRDTVRVFADRLVVLTDLGEDRENAREVQEGEERDPLRGASPTFYAEGNVRLEGPEVVLETDAFFFDHRKERGVAVRARGHGRLDAIARIQKILEPRGFSFLDQRAAGEEITPTIGPSPLPVENFFETPTLERSRADREGVTRGAPPRAEIGKVALRVAFRAEVLKALDLEHYEGEGLTISSCDYGVPHFGLHSRAMKITRLPPPGERAREEKKTTEQPLSAGEDSQRVLKRTEGEGEGEEPRDDTRNHFILDPEDTWFDVHGYSILPLPLGKWNTGWVEYNPIRNASYSNSSKFGNRVDVDWNLNWALRQLPGSELKAVDLFLDHSRLDLNTDYLSKRGTGPGVQGLYGKEPRDWKPWELEPDRWRYHGSGLAYWIDDRGKDRTAPEGTPALDNDRWWKNLLHRQRIPHVGVVDVEYSEQSDENFLREFFPFTRTEKDQESLFYFRRSFTDNLAATGLYKYRTNSFESTTERIPEGKLFLLEQPVFDTGLYTDLNLQAANLRSRPADELGEPSQRLGRYDFWNQWAYPLGLQDTIRFRPFANARATLYEFGAERGDTSLDREAFAAGVTASQNWSRVFPMKRGNWVDRWLGISALKHVIVPKVTYANVFENNLDSEKLVQFDEVDTVSEREEVEFSLRNLLWARSLQRQAAATDAPELPVGPRSPERPSRKGLRRIRSTTRVIVDGEASLRWFPRLGRDNDGDRFSLLDLDVTMHPLRYLSVRSRNFLDPNRDLEHDLTDNSVTIVPLREALRVTLGERFRRGVSEFLYARVGINFSRRYFLEAYYGSDLKTFNRTDVEVRLVRFFHRFALEVAYSFDAGEGNNQTVSVNFYPVETFTDYWQKRQRWTSGEAERRGE